MDTVMLCRGDICHWEDPIYGKHDSGNEVAKFETTTRYSRFVLILEDLDIYNISTMVAPLTRTLVYNGVAVDFDDCRSYIAVSKIMPVHRRSLTSYVTSLSDEKLLEVDLKIKELLLPGQEDDLKVSHPARNLNNFELGRNLMDPILDRDILDPENFYGMKNLRTVLDLYDSWHLNVLDIENISSIVKKDFENKMDFILFMEDLLYMSRKAYFNFRGRVLDFLKERGVEETLLEYGMTREHLESLKEIRLYGVLRRMCSRSENLDTVCTISNFE